MAVKNNSAAIQTIHTTPKAYLRVSDMVNFLPFSAATVWRKSKSGDLPAPVKLGDKITAWKTQDIRDWLASKEAA